MKTIEIPDFALVALVGASGSGKSTFAKTHFLPTETLSSDYFRSFVSDDETDQSATSDAFDALHHLAALRLKRRKLTVIDATNVQEGARKPLLDLARRYHAVPVAIVLDLPESVCATRNESRPNRDFGKHVVTRHVRDLRRSVKSLRKEGFRYVFHLDGEAAVADTHITRTPLWTDKRGETGPFDIIGDIHGCYDELCDLLRTLGYAPDDTGVYRHDTGRRLVFVGDLVDRGPKTVEAAILVMNAVQSGVAFCVPGNHDDKLKRALEGRKVTISHGLQESLDQIAALPDPERETFITRFVSFVDGLVSHLWLDGGNLAVAHAGVKAEMIGRASGAIREFCLYSDTTGEFTPDGFPVRRDWAAEYRGDPFVVYGHTPVDAVRIINNTANIDTGVVFGGSLSAIQIPEREIVMVAAREAYAVVSGAPTPRSSPSSGGGESEAESGNVSLSLPPYPPEGEGDSAALNLLDHTGRRVVSTRLAGSVIVAEGNNAAALEIMSRFAAHPRWLIYLPPTMSPVETATAEDYLEHPAEAFAYFGRQGVATVICEEKHMGSRAVIVVCRDGDAAKRHFGAEPGDLPGAVLTRTGRLFTTDRTLHEAILTETAQAINAAGLWDELETDWLCLDAELLPWNAKAQGLLKEQYAPVAAAGKVALIAEIALLEKAVERGVSGAEAALVAARSRLADLEAYRVAYGRYCWNVDGIADLRIAPFHIMAAQGRTFVDRSHPWHIEALGRLADHAPLFQKTATLAVNTGDEESVAVGTSWWLERTANGGEGMVVKPLSFLPPKRCQPAVKVRGREYLRIIYGPEYTQPANLKRLKERSLGAKRSLATREFALGVEGLERFISGDSLRRVHECAFSVLALESEPVDPRL
ncbi:MAG: polynucleotide kinase-phosphatase [Fibrella sp.]|nr:polynucleotide kinase-phosphatase [Armatimonadota bacterium]